MLILKIMFRKALIKLIIITRQCKSLPAARIFLLLAVTLFVSTWTLSSVAKTFKKVDIVYYIYFPWHEKYRDKMVKGCHGFFMHSGGTALQCKEYISLLRPLHTVKVWQREQKKMGFLSLTISEFGIKKAHGYIHKIESVSPERLTFHKKNTNARPVIGRFIRHVNNVREYQFKNIITGKISNIRSTPNHQFYVKNRGRFIPVENISAGDKMIQKDGQIIQMVCPGHNHTHCGLDTEENVVLVYNLEVSQKHTYFVGPSFIFSHNPCEVKERYRLFCENKFIDLVPDEDSGKLIQRFMVKSKRKDEFTQLCQPKDNLRLSEILSQTTRRHLNNLGFKSKTMKYRRAANKDKADVIWLLENPDKFRRIFAQDDQASSAPAAFNNITSYATPHPLPVPINPLLITTNPLLITTNPLLITTNPFPITTNPFPVAANPFPVAANPLPFTVRPLLHPVHPWPSPIRSSAAPPVLKPL